MSRYCIAHLLFLIVVGSLACTRGPRRTDVTIDAAQPAYPRYWLVKTTLLDAPGGKQRTEVTAPRLVELLPTARVRSVDATPQIEGFLPQDILDEPRQDRGLMLYAEKVGELHLYQPGGRVLGRLHPGAFVSVVPSEEAALRVGNLPFALSPEGAKIYVDRSVLGTESREPVAYRPAGRVVSVHMSHVMAWVLDVDPHATWTTLECEDQWVLENRLVSQYVRGFEIVGTGDHFVPATTAWAMSTQEGLRCPAHAVSTVDRIPKGYRRVELPDPDPLADVIEHRGALYWLQATEKGPVCDTWRFVLDAASSGKGKPHLDGRLVRQKPVEELGSRASHPMHYDRANAGKPGTLHLETLQLNGREAFKCECEYRYSLLHAEGGELEMMGRPLPENVVAYDPGDAERWFLSKKQCEVARDEVARAIEQDGTTATRVGLHAVVSSFGL